MDFYEQYKPFRNYMRQFPIVPSLINIWHLSNHIIYKRPLAPEFFVDKPKIVPDKLSEVLYPWDLDILSREVVLNGALWGSRSLAKWDDFANAINFMRRLDDAACSFGERGANDVMYELHRIAHRQFPWQVGNGAAPLMRAFKIFGAEAVECIVVHKFGMTMKQLMLLGGALSGSFLKNYGMSIDQDYSQVGIPKEASNAFLQSITITTVALRGQMESQQSYDHDWAYAWNPLELTPLVSFDPAYPARVICPIPSWLLRRTSGGIFFDLVKNSSFSNPFGNAFQTYAGDIIRATCKPPGFKVLAEQPYFAGQKRMHGVDWTVSDPTGHLFIEAKTKRLTVDAKTKADAIALDRDLRVMATAVVQHYKNIQRSLDGLTQWAADGLPIYPMVLTLEDWFVFSPVVKEMLERYIVQFLGEAGLSETLLERMPYVIASAYEFEILSQIIAKIGIGAVMSKLLDPSRRGWALLPQASGLFTEEFKHVDGFLFRAEFAQLWPELDT